jgi:hypothetical protein
MVVADRETQTGCSKRATGTRSECFRRIGPMILRLKAALNV